MRWCQRQHCEAPARAFAWHETAYACAHATTRMTYIRKFEHISALWWCREAPEYGVTARAATIAIARYSS